MNLQLHNTSLPATFQPLANSGVLLNQPPSSNTGVSPAYIYIDWLAFTVPSELIKDSEPSAVLELLELKEYTPVIENLNMGFQGYENRFKLCDGGLLGIGGQAGTCYITLSSTALGYYSSQGLDMIGWLRYLIDLGVRIKRLDLAFDDYRGLVTVTKVREFWHNGGVITRSHFKRYIESDDQGFIGGTCEFGKRTSESMVRIYDKAAEQKLAGVSWTRLELQFNGNRAEAVAQEWKTSNFSASSAVSIMVGTIDFRVNDGTATKSRWLNPDWWDTFTACAAAVRVIVSRATKTIEDVANWLNKSVAGGLAAFHKVYGDIGLNKLIQGGYVRMAPSHQRLVIQAGVGYA